MMARVLSFLLMTLLSAGAWANPCATGGRPFPVGEGAGMGGTGLQPDKTDGSGMGGTGHRDGSGSGGTGQQARTGSDGSGTGGTGVVGEITGFGSICVNGLEIHYDPQTPVSVDGQSGRADQLAVGQVVAVHAEGGGNELRARQIQVRHALVGRVETVNPNGQLRVLGQWVSPPRMSHVQSGERIKVSGYRADSRHVVASRIDPAQAGEPDLLTGEVEWTQPGVALVSGVRVRLPDGAAAPRAGEDVRVSGRTEDGGLRAERIGPDGVRGFLERVDHLSVKDRVRPASRPGKLKLGGMEFSLDAKTRVQGGHARELQPGRLVHMEARQKDGRVIVERIEIRDEKGGRSHEKPGTEPPKASPGAAGVTDASGAAREDGKRREPEDRAAEDDARENEDAGGRAEGEEKTGREEKSGRSGKAESVEKAEKLEKPEKAEKPEKPEKIEKPEKPEKIEKLERPEKPEKVEKPEKPEKPEKIEKPEKPEKIERPERPEREDD
jgi:hypothetical protein